MADPTQRTGSVDTAKGKDGKPLLWPSGRPRYFGRVRWPDKTRPRVNVPEAHCKTEELAAAFVRKTQEGIDAGGEGITPKPVAVVEGETIAEYFARWNKARALKLPRQAKADAQAFRLWLADEIGAIAIKAITRDRLIDLSHHLDQVAAKGEAFAERRARNIFAVVAAMFRDAYSSKDRALRVLAVNPMAGVPWPERGATKALKQLIYPSEFLALVSCPAVPLVRARLYAVTLYTTTRAAEVRVLDCAHVDVPYLNVKIVMSHDPTATKATGIAATKSTKSGKARIVTMEKTLAPVLAAMVAELGEGGGRLFAERPKDAPQANQWRPASDKYIPGPDGAYGLCGMLKKDLRAALAWAGIAERPELFDDSDRRASLSIRFHDLRASGITWRHARRDNPAAILQECGHEDQATNEIYIRALRGLAPADLFPPLPARLLGGAASEITAVRSVDRPANSPMIPVGAEGLEPPTSSV